MKTLMLAICLSGGSLWAGELVYSTITLQIIEVGVGDKSRFSGDPNYVVTEVSNSEIKKIDGNLSKLVYNPSTKTINRKSKTDVDRIDRMEKKAEIVALKTKLSSLLALRSGETDEETLTIIDESIVKIQETITKLE